MLWECSGGGDPAAALLCASAHPARLVGLKSKGHLAPGADADICLLDPTTRKATGARLRGVAKRIGETLWSDGELPAPPSDGVDKRGKHWRGEGGSLRRGTAVDRQVSRLCKLSERARSSTTDSRPLTRSASSATLSAAWAPRSTSWRCAAPGS